MLPTIHLVISIIIAAGLYPIFGWKVLFVVAGGYLIDADHYLFFVWKEKNFSLKRAYDYFRDRRKCYGIIKNEVLPFHTIEALIILTVLGLYLDIFLMAAFGAAFHIMLDWVDETLIYRDIKTPSIVLWLFSQKFYKQSTSTFSME